MNRIRELRKQRKLTQKELADYLQIADSTLSYWETGKYEPDNKSLKNLAGFFCVSVDHILGVDFNEGIKQAYLNAENQTFMHVAEQKTNYEAVRFMYNRKEFVDLTKDEIDKLAEYALFLKSQREEKDEKQ